MCQNLNHNDAVYLYSSYSLLQLNNKLGVDELFKNAIDRLYEQKRIQPTTRKKMMQELYEPLATAVKEGFSKEIKIEYNTPNYEFLKQLKTNVAVFAAFKNHARMKEVADQLTDANGNKRSKADFITEGLRINPKYKVQWLAVEYDAATRQARSAAQYTKALATKKLFPNIKYMPSVSAERRVEHMKYYGLVLPIEHKLWDKILPIKVFGCKCWWKVTDEAATGVPENLKIDDPADGLGVHAGKTGQVFDLNDSGYIKSVPPDQQPKLIKEATAMVNEMEAMEQPYFTIHTSKKTGAVIDTHPYAIIKNSDFETNLNKAKALTNRYKVKMVEILPDVPAELPELRKELVPFFKGRTAADLRIDNDLYDLKEDGQQKAGKSTIKDKFSKARMQADGIVLYISNTDYITRDELYRQINSKYQEAGGQYLDFKLYLFYNKKWLHFKGSEDWKAFMGVKK